MTWLTQDPTRILFFTGKGGVGKTSTACATAVKLADSGKQVLLVSTDPASNLDEVLGETLGMAPLELKSVPGLWAMNVNPAQAAKEYRERIVGPYRGVLPVAAIEQIEEQLSGACTVEIAAFDEFTKLLGDPECVAAFDHVIFDTAPTGHTLRLLQLPAAWSNFIETNVGGTSCLGPLSGLGAKRELYASSRDVLRDGQQTTIVLVTRPEHASFKEANRTYVEFRELGMNNVRLIVNGVFSSSDRRDPIAQALERRGTDALHHLTAGLAMLPRLDIEQKSFAVVGIDALRALLQPGSPSPNESEGPSPKATSEGLPAATHSLDSLILGIAESGRGVVMTMGKGGVGKTTLAARIATRLADLGHKVLLTTTDPAAHVADCASPGLGTLEVSRIDPEVVTQRYRDEVLASVGSSLDADGRALLEEELKSPCTTEIAVFRSFAETVALGETSFVVIDTAPTGHTLLLLDATEAYHREVLRKNDSSPDSVRRLLPRLRDPLFTRIVLVTLPEAIPVHEAMQLEQDLARAQIAPLAWVVNQSFLPLDVTCPSLRSRRLREAEVVLEVSRHHHNVVLEPWRSDVAPLQ